MKYFNYPRRCNMNKLIVAVLCIMSISFANAETKGHSSTKTNKIEQVNDQITQGKNKNIQQVNDQITEKSNDQLSDNKK